MVATIEYIQLKLLMDLCRVRTIAPYVLRRIAVAPSCDTFEERIAGPQRVVGRKVVTESQFRLRVGGAEIGVGILLCVERMGRSADAA